MEKSLKNFIENAYHVIATTFRNRRITSENEKWEKLNFSKLWKKRSNKPNKQSSCLKHPARFTQWMYSRTVIQFSVSKTTTMQILWNRFTYHGEMCMLWCYDFGCGWCRITTLMIWQQNKYFHQILFTRIWRLHALNTHTISFSLFQLFFWFVFLNKLWCLIIFNALFIFHIWRCQEKREQNGIAS